MPDLGEERLQNPKDIALATFRFRARRGTGVYYALLSTLPILVGDSIRCSEMKETNFDGKESLKKTYTKTQSTPNPIERIFDPLDERWVFVYDLRKR